MVCYYLARHLYCRYNCISDLWNVNRRRI